MIFLSHPSLVGPHDTQYELQNGAKYVHLDHMELKSIDFRDFQRKIQSRGFTEKPPLNRTKLQIWLVHTG